MNAPPKWLWAGAAAVSLGLHAGIGMALYAMPMPQAKPSTETRITVETLRTETATPQSGGAIVAASVPTAAVAALDLADPLEASVPDAVAAQAAPPQAAIAPSAAAPSLDPVADPPPAPTGQSDATATSIPIDAPLPVAPADPVEASSSKPAMPSVQPSTSSDVAQPGNTAPIPLQSRAPDGTAAPEVRTRAALAPIAEPIPDTPADIKDVPADIAPPSPATLAAPGETFAAPEAADLRAAPIARPTIIQPPGPSADTLPTIVNSQTPREAIPPAAMPAASDAAGIAPSADPPDMPAAVAFPSVGPATPTVAALPVGSTSTAVASPAPSNFPLQVAAAATTTAAAPAAIPSFPALPTATVQAVPAPGATLSAAPIDAAENRDLALATPQDGLPGPSTGEIGGQLDGKPARVRVADFLRREKDTAECLLALPTGVGLLEASIAAFSDSPAKVARLGDEYSRQSGVELQASTYAVSQRQCGALGFARDLAQYPNFPIRVTLSQSTIGSGQELSGVISGLRKDMLYLMVVDDEGKAELVQSYSDLRANTMPFRAPMTLTSGPVSSVQLLVAIASDGPLKTVANRPGLPADDYFTRLKAEIITDNHPIAYGIVAFRVR